MKHLEHASGEFKIAFCARIAARFSRAIAHMIARARRFFRGRFSQKCGGHFVRSAAPMDAPRKHVKREKFDDENPARAPACTSA
ncbi:MAG: hypothetical protein V4633_12010 [Pseudomonadota bacterium]